MSVIRVKRDATTNVRATFEGGPLRGTRMVLDNAPRELRLPGLRGSPVRTRIVYRRRGRWMIGVPPYWPYIFVREEIMK